MLVNKKGDNNFAPLKTRCLWAKICSVWQLALLCAGGLPHITIDRGFWSLDGRFSFCWMSAPHRNAI